MHLLKRQKEETGECSDLRQMWQILVSLLIVDSGATHHICSNLNMFESYEKYENAQISIIVANEKKSKVEHIGSVKLGNGMVLKNVMHVPGFRFNLISTHQLCKDLNCSIVFTHNKCML